LIGSMTAGRADLCLFSCFFRVLHNQKQGIWFVARAARTSVPAFGLSPSSCWQCSHEQLNNNPARNSRLNVSSSKGRISVCFGKGVDRVCFCRRSGFHCSRACTHDLRHGHRSCVDTGKHRSRIRIARFGWLQAKATHYRRLIRQPGTSGELAAWQAGAGVAVLGL
jgi:hypothetical protein